MSKPVLRRKRNKGQTLMEYGLIVALISVVCIAVLTASGDQLGRIFGEVRDALSGVSVTQK
jgi:Flp pilus assembly pilin Flp